MRLFRFILLAAALVLCQSAKAQIKILPKERVDSIANPPLAPNAGNVAFEREMITAEFASGDAAPRTFEYGFVNNGKDPLVITRLVSTCSCASAVCPAINGAPLNDLRLFFCRSVIISQDFVNFNSVYLGFGRLVNAEFCGRGFFWRCQWFE